MREDIIDYLIYIVNIKRKRLFLKRGGKIGRVFGRDDEDYEEDDEDWIGGGWRGYSG